ncbi:maltokinase [Streptomyces sp. SID13666]|uniref:maltokinase N-terminal cap-like domain-containing protein n=1 Tax=unclassified Streptomyces TaxID=2593676 RepID=UPI0013BED4B6|nr:MULTISPECIES: phosphotransferase [unclassified Streptomyces]NEA60675.1 maltokinase [Streptomyces sp. SID13666]NEA77088.1 maltokinase [Streptomyces sp. SID13588]
MSDSSWTRTSPTTGRSPATAPGLLHSLSPLLLEWLPQQRWFAGKGRPITGFDLVSATELLPLGGRLGTPGLLHLLLDVEQTGRRADCYQLLLGTRTLLPPSLAPAAVGQATGGPLDGLTIYEGLYDPRLTAVLLERLRAPGRTGRLRFLTEPSATVPAGLAPRLSTAEQSNTSVIYGDEYILKVFRRVSPGANPDLELSLALARDGSRRVAAPAAWFEALELPEPAGTPDGIGAEPATLGVLQRYLPGSADGWELALRAMDDGTEFTADARALGAATAEVHAALARALPTGSLDRRRIQLIAATMAQRLDTAAAEVPELRPYRTRLRAAFHDLSELGGTGARVAAQRIHGDLHLGQALRTADHDWLLIDFEGEPSRPLSERRLPAPPVQDVAGMLRSFDYAARHRDPAAPTAGAWAERHRDAFCTGYAATSGTDPRDQPVLIRAYETDKAVYEVLYEARHRPAWLPIPMSAIDRLASNPPPRRITP